jgi:anti-sigma-K factor RskA
MSSEEVNHVHDVLPAFVLGILTDEEASHVVEHLAECDTCQTELTRLQQVADDLPLALSQTTPPTMVKEKLMQAIRSTQPEVIPVSQPSFWQRLASPLRTLAPVVGAAIIVVLAVVNLLLWRQLSFSNQQAVIPMQVIALANTQYAPGAQGTLIMNQPGDYGTLVVDKLAALDSGHQYQVWLIKDEQRLSGGLFSVNPEGYASLEIQTAKPLSQYDSVGITIEPFGGSPGPTGSKVLGGSIPH